MRLLDAIKEGVEIVKLNREAIRRVAAEPEAFSMGIIITALQGIAAWLEPTSCKAWELFTNPPLAIFWLFVFSAIFHFVALLLGGRGDYMALLRVAGVGHVLGWVLIVPWLGKLACLLWSPVVAVVVLQEVYRLDQFKAIMCVVLPVMVFVFLGVVLVTAFFSLTTLSFLFGI